MGTRHVLKQLKMIFRSLLDRRRNNLQNRADEMAMAIEQQDEQVEDSKNNFGKDDQPEWGMANALANNLKPKIFFVSTAALAAIVSGGFGSSTLPFIVFFAAFILLCDVLMRVFGELTTITIYVVGGIAVLAVSGFYN